MGIIAPPKNPNIAKASEKTPFASRVYIIIKYINILIIEISKQPNNKLTTKSKNAKGETGSDNPQPAGSKDVTKIRGTHLTKAFAMLFEITWKSQKLYKLIGFTNW